MSLVRKLVAAGACATVMACNGPQGSPVPINTGDTTSPVIYSLATVGRQAGDLDVNQTSGPLTGALSATDSIQVAARADDPDGVRQVAIWGTERKTCTDPQSGLGTITGPGLAGAPIAESTETATGTTTNQRVVSTPVRISDYSCPQGQKLSLELVFWATGQNFGGGTAQSDQLTLTFTAP